MVSHIRIFIEGGGDRSDTKAAVREGFSKFLEPLRRRARERGIGWDLLACGSREVAFDRFKSGSRDNPASYCILLVDSEAPVTRGPWMHLKERDGWTITGCSAEQCHLMVHSMESWLLADPAALAEFYGQGFRIKALPRMADVEAISKEKVAAALARATQETQKGRYHKIRHGPDLLGRLDPAQVRQRAKHCDRLFATLETILQ
jgi:hypothetical protein